MKSQEVANIFREIAQILEIKGENVFRIRAYERAAQTVDNLGDKLESIASQDKLTTLPGIGTDLAAKIKEIIDTGSLKYYNQLKKSIPSGLIDMLAIQGLGPKTVKLFYDKLEIDSIKKLEKYAKSGKLQELEGIKAKTEENILRGIELRKKSSERTLFYLAAKIADNFIEQIKKIKEVDKIEVAGSLRRKKETIRDIDILVTSKKPLVVMDKFVQLPLVAEVLAKGQTKASIIAKESNIQVDLRVIERKSFGSALIYFTGSKEFNIRLRQLAIRKNYKVNEYGVFSTKTKKETLVAGKTEKEIFSLMKMDYISPELREDRGEIEAALKKKLPKLIEKSNIKGDLHVHSVYSDGRNTIEEVAKAAKSFGFKFIGISDHSQSLRVANGLSVKELHKKIKEVKAVDKRLSGIKVLCGTEADILSDGQIDYPDSVLKELDFVIAAIHSGFKQSREQLTKRIISACKNKYVNIIAHPTGILSGMRDAYEIDLEEVLKAACDHKVALEINCHPQRLDLNDINAMKAKEAKAKLFLGTDSHDISQFEFIDLGVNIARRGWLKESDVINCMDLTALLKWLKK
jgi:DNA polymerase (family 10)